MSKVLVLAAHPDDETLGCGGTLLKHKDGGDEIYWLIATSMTAEHGFKKSLIARRDEEIKTVSKMYGFDGVYRLDLPTARLDEISTAEIIAKISNVFDEVKPNIIYFPFRGDVHSDHRIMFDAAYSCTKSFRYPFIKKILMMETISETEFSPSSNEHKFHPNYFVDVTDYLDRQIDIVKCYESEIGNHPFPRSLENIRALGTFRGATAGCLYSESFMMLKEIW
jgi:LmbE family N-acetylglucosaminyl deacetylase